MLTATRDARKLMEEAGAYRTNAPVRAVALADALSKRAANLADAWIPVRQVIAQSVTNEEQAATIIAQIEQAQAKTKNAEKELGDLGDGAYAALSDVEHEYVLIDNEKDAAKLCEEIMTFQEVSFDTETTSVDAISAQLVGLSFAVAGGKAWYVAVPRETEAAQRMVDIFRPFYESDTILKV